MKYVFESKSANLINMSRKNEVCHNLNLYIKEGLREYSGTVKEPVTFKYLVTVQDLVTSDGKYFLQKTWLHE